MPGEDGEGAVELLGEHDAGQFVRKRQRRKRKLLRGAAAQSFGKSFRIAAQKNNFARAAVARFAEPLCELRRRLRFSRVVQQDHGRVGSSVSLRSEAAESSRNSVSCTSANRPMRATIVVQQRADFRTAGFSEHDQVNFHRGSPGFGSGRSFFRS